MGMILHREHMLARLEARDDQWIMSSVIGLDSPFTRSNGTVMARIYERLTKASRRNAKWTTHEFTLQEQAYRQGVYDAFKALQDELNE